MKMDKKFFHHIRFDESKYAVKEKKMTSFRDTDLKLNVSDIFNTSDL